MSPAKAVTSAERSFSRHPRAGSPGAPCVRPCAAAAPAARRRPRLRSSTSPSDRPRARSARETDASSCAEPATSSDVWRRPRRRARATHRSGSSPRRGSGTRAGSSVSVRTVRSPVAERARVRTSISSGELIERTVFVDAIEPTMAASPMRSTSDSERRSVSARVVARGDGSDLRGLQRDRASRCRRAARPTACACARRLRACASSCGRGRGADGRVRTGPRSPRSSSRSPRSSATSCPAIARVRRAAQARVHGALHLVRVPSRSCRNACERDECRASRGSVLADSIACATSPESSAPGGPPPARSSRVASIVAGHVRHRRCASTPRDEEQRR